MADETYTPISVTSDTAGIDWKARAEELERELNDWRNGDLRGVQAHWHAALARAEAAEARVRELEARKRSLTEDVMTLGTMVYDENAVEWRERALKAERRLTVTDEMVERAEAELDALFSGSPNCTLSDIARAALTAALEGKK